jgi:hypothetical protein
MRTLGIFRIKFKWFRGFCSVFRSLPQFAFCPHVNSSNSAFGFWSPIQKKKKKLRPVVVRGSGSPSHPLCKPLSPLPLWYATALFIRHPSPPEPVSTSSSCVYKAVKYPPLLVSVCCPPALFVIVNDPPRIHPSCSVSIPIPMSCLFMHPDRHTHNP